jgi:hypothetical protein
VNLHEVTPICEYEARRFIDVVEALFSGAVAEPATRN